MKRIPIYLLLLACVLTFSSCKKKIEGCTNPFATNYNSVAEEDDGSCTYLVIGQEYQGGILAYILQQGDPGYDPSAKHGIIAAPYDQSTGADWGCSGTFISGADGIAIYSGYQNTQDIIIGCTELNTAASICNNLVIGGYSDWYLPSKNELNALYINKTAIGGFNDAYYWTSTEINEEYAYSQHFGTGAIGTGWPDGYGAKNHFVGTTGFVRAIRAF